MQRIYAISRSNSIPLHRKLPSKFLRNDLQPYYDFDNDSRKLTVHGFHRAVHQHGINVEKSQPSYIHQNEDNEPKLRNLPNCKKKRGGGGYRIGERPLNRIASVEQRRDCVDNWL